MTNVSNTVIFQNSGLIDIRGITTFGVCAKESNSPIGYFGTGLKYAIAILLREGQKITVYRGKEKHVMTVKSSIMRGTKFDFCYRNKIRLPFTTELGKNWNLWQAYRELHANTLDEHDCYITDNPQIKLRRLLNRNITTIIVEGDLFHKIYNDRASIFLETEPIHTFKELEVHSGDGEWIYYKGIRVLKPICPAMFNYNITIPLTLTEDRTAQDTFKVDWIIARTIAECDIQSFIRTVLEANEERYESHIDYDWSFIEPGEIFNKTIERYRHSGYNYYNTSARSLYDKKVKEIKLPIEFKKLSKELQDKLNEAIEFWNTACGIFKLTTIRIIPTRDLRVDQLCTTCNDNNIYVSEQLLNKSIHEIVCELYYAYTEIKFPQRENRTKLIIDQIVSLIEEFNNA